MNKRLQYNVIEALRTLYFPCLETEASSQSTQASRIHHSIVKITKYGIYSSIENFLPNGIRPDLFRAHDFGCNLLRTQILKDVYYASASSAHWLRGFDQR